MSKKVIDQNEMTAIVDQMTRNLMNRQVADGVPAGYAYAAGYLESLLAQVLLQLPAGKQKFYVDMIKEVK